MFNWLLNKLPSRRRKAVELQKRKEQMALQLAMQLAMQAMQVAQFEAQLARERALRKSLLIRTPLVRPRPVPYEGSPYPESDLAFMRGLDLTPVHRTSEPEPYQGQGGTFDGAGASGDWSSSPSSSPSSSADSPSDSSSSSSNPD